jgi:cytoskeleton protein RodZ
MTEDKAKVSQSNPQLEARQQFGAMLREAREKAGYSIEELAHATKILMQFLEALEAGEFERLPGEVFIRGFSKSIAKVIHCDPVELMRLVDIATDHRRTERLLVVQGSPGASTVRVGNEYHESNFGPRKVLQTIKSLDRRIYLGAATLAVGLVLGYGAIYQIQKWASESDLSENQQAAKPAKPAVKPEDTATTPPPAEQAAANTTAVADQAQSLTVTSTGEPTLILNVKEAVDIRVNVDQRGWESSKYTPDTYKINFKDQVNVLILDAAAVDVVYNGKSLGNLGAKGKVRRLSFVAEAPVQPEKKL